MAYTTRFGRTAYADVSVIPLNAERNLQLQIGNLMFTDLCQFLASSLDNLVKILKKSGSDQFLHTSEHYGTSEEYYETQFAETALPPKEAFYNKLTNSISLTTSTTEPRKFGSCGR